MESGANGEDYNNTFSFYIPTSLYAASEPEQLSKSRIKSKTPSAYREMPWLQSSILAFQQVCGIRTKKPT